MKNLCFIDSKDTTLDTILRPPNYKRESAIKFYHFPHDEAAVDFTSHTENIDWVLACSDSLNHPDRTAERCLDVDTPPMTSSLIKFAMPPWRHCILSQISLRLMKGGTKGGL
jgi:hypothetical protein